MNLRSGTVVGAHILKPEHRPAFEEGVRQTFKRWTALSLAIEHGWGGDGGKEKGDAMVDEVIEWFYHCKGGCDQTAECDSARVRQVLLAVMTLKAGMHNTMSWERACRRMCCMHARLIMRRCGQHAAIWNGRYCCCKGTWMIWNKDDDAGWLGFIRTPVWCASFPLCHNVLGMRSLVSPLKCSVTHCGSVSEG
eukprot:362231-Chlamydomonas_euryale.AAC.8